jgi:hypothetical protein
MFTVSGGKFCVGWSGGTAVAVMDAHATEARELTYTIDLSKFGTSGMRALFYHNDVYGAEVPTDVYITEWEFITK